MRTSDQATRQTGPLTKNHTCLDRKWLKTNSKYNSFCKRLQTICPPSRSWAYWADGANQRMRTIFLSSSISSLCWRKHSKLWCVMFHCLFRRLQYGHSVLLLVLGRNILHSHPKVGFSPNPKPLKPKPSCSEALRFDRQILTRNYLPRSASTWTIVLMDLAFNQQDLHNFTQRSIRQAKKNFHVPTPFSST